MQIILLSGGSGTRLWPLSNDARSKQFLRLLPVEGGDGRESMIQRVLRQIAESKLNAPVTVATGASQKDAVMSQAGETVNVVTEPCRRDTFPAICLACEYLLKEKRCDKSETVVVMPCDPYTGSGYFDAVARMAAGVEKGVADILVMGIEPTYPSAKYGYVVPATVAPDSEYISVQSFTEKPDVARAKELISQGAMWNGGVFAFRLGYLCDIADRYMLYPDFNDYVNHYADFPKISFDYEVAEKADSIAMVPYSGTWKDLGTWNTLTDELEATEYGNVLTDGTSCNTHLFNELGIPMLCIGTRDLVVAASPDGIIISEKSKSENVKEYASQLKHRPMYEERRWGTYTVLDSVEYSDGFCALTKRLTLTPGNAISYQRHSWRDEVWTFIDGDGEIVLDGVRRPVKRGETVYIPKGQLHALRATTPLTFIEVQNGSNLVEEDIERFDFEW